MVSIVLVGDEMEDGAVVPDVKGTEGIGLGDVGDEPLDICPAVTQSSAGRIDGVLGDVEEGDTMEVGIEKAIDEQRLSAPDIDHGIAGGIGHFEDQSERELGIGFVPANFAW